MYKNLDVKDKNHIHYVCVKLKEILDTDAVHKLQQNENLYYVKHIILHRQAFARVEHKTKYHGMFSNEHDIDKIGTALILGRDEARRLHKQIAPHHNAKPDCEDKNLIVEKIFDWECSHYTKLGKSKTAYEYMVAVRSEFSDAMTPYLKELGLWEERNATPLTKEHYKQMEDSIDMETIIAEVRKSYNYLKGLS